MTAFITIDPVKVELEMTTSTDDAALTAKVAAACTEIERRIGHVSPASFVETLTVGDDGAVILSETPVLAIVDVQQLAADGTVLVDLGASTDADTSGVLYGLPYGAVRVTYTAGLNPIPSDYVEAAVQLAAHLWRQSRSLTVDGRLRSEMTMGPGMSSAMPNKVKDLLGLTGKANRSKVFVG